MVLAVESLRQDPPTCGIPFEEEAVRLAESNKGRMEPRGDR